ncbi:MAG: nucleotidyltransferase domain-containing protein, partial [Sphingobacterium sp.]
MNGEQILDSQVGKAFFSALKSGLWGSPIDPALFAALSPEQWVALYRMSALQTVEGCICEGIQKLPANALPPKELLVKWMVRLQQIEQRNVWMNGIIADQVAFFEKENLRPLMQKGQGVAQYYARPLSRVCGDIDWCFSNKQDYNRAVELLNAKGIDVKFSHGYSLSYKWNGCDIEHHQDLIELRDPFKLKYLKKLEEIEAAHHMQLDMNGALVRIPAPILNIVLVNVHILKHLVTYGIGARQLCDAAVLYDKMFDTSQGEYLKKVYKRLGILKWIYVLHEVLVKHIGLDPAKLPFAQPQGIKADWM